jgi:hypothetical protein
MVALQNLDLASPLSQIVYKQRVTQQVNVTALGVNISLFRTTFYVNAPNLSSLRIYHYNW